MDEKAFMYDMIKFGTIGKTETELSNLGIVPNLGSLIKRNSNQLQIDCFRTHCTQPKKK